MFSQPNITLSATVCHEFCLIVTIADLHTVVAGCGDEILSCVFLVDLQYSLYVKVEQYVAYKCIIIATSKRIACVGPRCTCYTLTARRVKRSKMPQFLMSDGERSTHSRQTALPL